MKTSTLLHSLLSGGASLLFASAIAFAAPTGPALADGKPKFLGGVHSSAQAVNLLAYWNQITPENAGKWGSVEATRDVMNWAQLDTAYAMAKDNGLPFRFHILVWGNQQPAWIATLPADEQLAEIQEWFAAVAERYPDIDFLEVVNEPINDAPDGLPGRFDAAGSVDPNDGNYINALGGTGTTGWDWVINAFKLARAAFPDTPLVLNEYSIVNDPNTMSRYVGLINLLKAERLVDIVSEQGHTFTIGSMSAASLTNGLNSLAATGLPIMITEMDITGTSSTTADDTTQLTRYQTVFPALWEHPAVLGITTWGYRPPMWQANAVLVLADDTERSAMTWLRTYVASMDPPLRPTFTHSPRDLTRTAGQSASFTARVRGNPTPTLQWQRSTDGGGSWSDISDDATFSGSTTATLTIASVTGDMSGHRFRLSGTNGVGSALTTYDAAITVQVPPSISMQPVNATTTAGGVTTLSVTADGPGTLTYQWFLDGTAVAGATEATYRIPSTQAFHAGSYTVTVTNGDGSITSDAATVTVNPAPASNARLMNLSTRGYDLTGDNQLIPGFVIEGTGTKRILLRSVGPGLASALSTFLPDPQLTLIDQDTGATVDANDDWGTNANKATIITTTQDVGAGGLAEDSKDAVLLVDLAPGHYTALAAGVGGQTGIALVEFYDADDAPTAQLVNMSTRGFVGTGDNIMIPGFVISQEGSRTLLVRAVGPALASALSGYLEDPTLTVFRTVNASSEPILVNDDWDTGPQAATTAAVADQVGAQPLAAGSKDAALVVTLPPGVYTIHAAGKNGGTGIALVEVYLVPN